MSKETIKMGLSVRQFVRRCKEGVLCERILLQFYFDLLCRRNLLKLVLSLRPATDRKRGYFVSATLTVLVRSVCVEGDY